LSRDGRHVINHYWNPESWREQAVQKIMTKYNVVRHEDPVHEQYWQSLFCWPDDPGDYRVVVTVQDGMTAKDALNAANDAEPGGRLRREAGRSFALLHELDEVSLHAIERGTALREFVLGNVAGVKERREVVSVACQP
jgi:hypothetical protein